MRNVDSTWTFAWWGFANIPKFSSSSYLLFKVTYFVLQESALTQGRKSGANGDNCFD